MRKGNPIGTGTVNLSLNAPADWARELGKAAFGAGARSIGDFLRKLIERGAEAENPELAAQLREIRRRYYGATLALLFIAGMVATWLHPEDWQRGCRRCARRGGCRFEECVAVEVEEV